MAGIVNVRFYCKLPGECDSERIPEIVQFLENVTTKLYSSILFLCPIHTADADATKLFCRVGVGGVNTRQLSWGVTINRTGPHRTAPVHTGPHRTLLDHTGAHCTSAGPYRTGQQPTDRIRSTIWKLTKQTP